MQRLNIVRQFKIVDFVWKEVLGHRQFITRTLVTDCKILKQDLIKSHKTLRGQSSQVAPDSVRKFRRTFLLSARNFTKMPSDKEEWGPVLYYWFDELTNPSERVGRWFGTPKDEVEEKFGDLVKKARNGELKSWESDPLGTLALITLLDQFCRTLYKGTPDAFSHDHVALELCKKFLPGGPFSSKDLTFSQRTMLWLPLEHSENMEDQKTCVKAYEELLESATTEEERKTADGNLAFAKQHQDVIAKYGRFPRRNAALGRKNTPEEEELLKDYPYIF